MKTKLSIEESAKLIELGVDAKLASKWEIVDTTDENDPNSFLDYEEYPIFGLEDILSILPKEIDGNVLDLLATGYNKETEELENGWTATYIDKQCIPSFGEDAVFSAPELIDALYQLLIWCLKEKKINLNTDKK